MNIQIDTEQIKTRFDLRVIAAQYVTLRKASIKELEGPCPKCGGTDRFHCQADWFHCRQCHPERGDVIEFFRWKDRLSFVAACEYLNDGKIATIVPPREPEKKEKKQSQEWWDHAKELAEIACNRLNESSEAEAGRVYLSKRGLLPSTWKAFKLGFVPAASLPGTSGKQKAPAISIPWVVGGQVVAVRYRFFETHTYTDGDGEERTAKQTALPGSNFSGKLFGGHALTPGYESKKTIVISEGEINCMSIWQESRGTFLETLSFGSENATITHAIKQRIMQYAHQLTWLDRRELVQARMVILPGAYGIQSPDGMDANDLLQRGQLSAFLTEIRFRMLQQKEAFTALEGLLWDLWDNVQMNTIDMNTWEVMNRIASSLGKTLSPLPTMTQPSS